MIKTLLTLYLLLTPSAVHAWSPLPWSKQMEIRDRWLTKRHATILELMRKHGVQMWIVVNEEFHDDPLTELVAPARPYAGNRDFFVFVDARDKGLRRIAVTGFAEEAVSRFFESPADPRPAKEALPGIYRMYRPARIALSIGGSRGVTRSLTHESWLFLTETLGPEASRRIVPASDLIEEYLDTRIPEEMETYRGMVELTEELVKRTLSGEAIVPGKTTVGDLRRWMYDALWEKRVDTWFQPDIRIQRRGMTNNSSRGFLAVSPESWVVERGDVLHIDFGIRHMGLNTDWQKMAYVLRPGETDAPAGLKRALANTMALQDALVAHSRPGKTAGDVYNETMAQMTRQGIEAKIYSHPLGNQGHALGASIDYRSAQRKETMPSSRRLRKGSYIAIELNTLTPVPEWDGQKLFVMEEDPAHLTDEGWKFFVPRQEAFYLIP
ncbi:MAG TPA: M24 family metallopeptidase [Thermoanaerobaculia bacterium]|nr:M24 family metallopeptidase [Thermoanaerobaculia bacterium]